MISPWALSWDDENYYLVGFDSEAGMIKHYRLDKMEKIEIFPERRDGKEHFGKFDMAVYSGKFFGMFGGEESTVQISFENSLIGVVVDRFGRDVWITREDDERFCLTVKVAVSPQFLAWVFSFGGAARIRYPDSVIESFRELARRAAGE